MITGFEAALLAVGAAAAAIKIHDFCEGQSLVRDVADELALGRRSLAAPGSGSQRDNSIVIRPFATRWMTSGARA